MHAGRTELKRPVQRRHSEKKEKKREKKKQKAKKRALDGSAKHKASAHFKLSLLLERVRSLIKLAGNSLGLAVQEQNRMDSVK